MVLPGVDRTEALKAALRVRSTIASHAFEHGEKQPLGHVSISGGISTWPADGSDVESLLRCADEARQHAKRSGRDRVFAYMPTSLATHEPHFEAALEKPEP